MPMKIKIDRTRCTSSGRCAWYASDIFGQDDDTGLAVILKEVYTDADKDLIRDAVDNCPTAAISVEEG